ncbi:efflux transporter, RND family, MFP subunit [Sphingobium chlorophenolicum L-1]|uniref:Efflux transporter, RND family, MFP subunit n=1 Tax=Sphingobium chlorophenolicum L-1 TaxID=690566 RepID=F6EZ81_SPHCR|nr:efflux RND transporter periplasmic adaptor subunit [Sphingobium chlorophenolicum]AEG50174.1 efflux transporter, RND family, MFP subunit [Sphingobium chlorophenolicum L-1]
MSISSCARTVGILGLAAGALAGCGQSDADPRTAPPLVRIAAAGAAEGADREFAGIVGSRVQSDLGFRVAGKVVARLVDAGQVVRRGQPLMRIDPTDYTLAAQSADSTVAAARARAVQTAADEARYRDLVSAGAVSASAYDQAKAAALSARAQLSAAEAQARVSRNDAGYTVLVADADGTVAETLAEPGQVVAAGQTVVRLARSGPREAIVALPETLRPALGTEAEARTFSGLGGTARLRQLSDAADPATRTFEARFVLAGAPAAAPLGSTVTIRLGVPGQAPTLSVPLGAIYDRGKGPGVWVVEGRNVPKVNWRPVKLAAIGEESATVTAGLRPGERFVALGAHMLHQGQQVRIAAGAVR